MNATPGGPRPGRRAAVALALLLALLTFAAFSPTLRAGFIEYDDNEYVTDNLRVLDGLTAGGVRWALTSFANANWHPLTWLSHMADVQLYGLEPRGHHLTSVALHALGTVALFLVLRAMTGATLRSALVAALFAVHPLHVQSVAWIAERKDVLSGLFWFLTLGAYVRYARAPSRARSLAVAAVLALGLAAKPMLVTIPVILLLLDYWPLGRISRRSWRRDARRLVAEKGALWALAASSSALTIVAQHQGLAVKALTQVPLDARLWNAALSCLRYLGKALAPHDLSVFYPHPGQSLSPAVGLASLLLLGTLTALAARAGARRGYFLTGWLWYLVALLPVIGLVQVGPQGMADRYTYLPLVGPFILAVWGAADAARGRLARAAAAGGAVGLVLLLAALTWREAGFWRSSLTLAEHSIAGVGKNGVLLTILGTHLSRAGRLDEALPVLREAVALEPGGPDTHYNLASALARAGNLDEAVTHYRLSLQNSPDDAGAHLALFSLLSALGRGDEAAGHLREAARLAPDHPIVQRELSRLLEDQGRLGEALEHARRAVEGGPRDPRNLVRLGLVLARLARFDEALVAFLRATELDPARADAWYNAGRIHDLRGERQAAAHYRRAVTLEPGSAGYHVSLGAVLMELDAVAEARAHFLEALRLEPANPEARANLLRAGASTLDKAAKTR